MKPLAPGTITEAFRLIREGSIPACGEIIDMLERRMLLDESVLALIYQGNSGHSVRADLLEPQPQDDGYHELMADVYDMRRGK